MTKTKMKTRVAAILAAMVCATSVVGMGTTAFAASPDTPTSVSSSVQFSSREELSDYIYKQIEYNKTNLSKAIYNQQQYKKYDLSGNTLTVAQITEKSLDQRTSDFSVMDDIKSVTYPGSLIKINEDFANGTPSKISVKRNEMNFSVDCGRKKCTFTAIPQTEGDILEKVNEIIDDYSDHDVPAQIVTSFVKASSSEQVKAELNVSADILKKLNINFEADHKNQETSYIIRFRQVYYTVSADRPDNAEDVFADSVTKQILMREGVNSDNAPAYISSVSYGRDIYVVLKTSKSNTSIKAAEKLEACSFSIEAKQEWKQALANCSVNMIILGGSSEGAKDIMNIKDYDSFINSVGKELKFSKATCAYPLSYTARYLGTNKYVETKTAVSYSEVKYRTSSEIPVTLDLYGMWGRVKSGKFKISGKCITDVDDNGNFIYGTYYCKEYNFENNGSRKTVNISIPANVDPTTIKIKFDYSGTMDCYFAQDEYDLGAYLRANPNESIDSLVLQLSSSARWWGGYYVEASVWKNKELSDCNTGESYVKSDKDYLFYTWDCGARK
ncbi:MAG: thiol-activated cytolysin family protein [Acutalibacteraceae bacterium]